MSYTEKVQNESSRGKIGDYLKRIRADKDANQTRTVGMPLVSSDLDEIEEEKKILGRLGSSDHNPCAKKGY